MPAAGVFRAVRASLSGLLLAILAALAVPARAATVSGVECVGMTVGDADRSSEFFTKVLTFTKVSETETAGSEVEHLFGVFGARARFVRLELGEECVELAEFLAPRGRPFPADSRGNDRWFQHVAIIVRDMDAAYRRLREHRVVHASTGPQRLPETIPAAAGIEAFYFRGPDGHFLEILAFPPDKGPAKWHRSSGPLFLGIDHTAIVVEDTDASLRFYRDTLGLRVAGESENFGTEQEHLNNVFGARLRITALRAGSGPGIELLEYLAPRDGRPYPADAKASDLLHWHTRLLTSDLAAAERDLRGARARLVSPASVTLPDGKLGYRKSFLVRDPDGHAMQLAETRPR